MSRLRAKKGPLIMDATYDFLIICPSCPLPQVSYRMCSRCSFFEKTLWISSIQCLFVSLLVWEVGWTSVRMPFFSTRWPTGPVTWTECLASVWVDMKLYTVTEKLQKCSRNGQKWEWYRHIMHSNRTSEKERWWLRYDSMVYCSTNRKRSCTKPLSFHGNF